MDKDLHKLYGFAMIFLLKNVSKTNLPFFTQKEFEENYAIIIELSKLKSNLKNKIDV